jgi:BolA family transcriptional regulator, general stress-responsive regulator
MSASPRLHKIALASLLHHYQGVAKAHYGPRRPGRASCRDVAMTIETAIRDKLVKAFAPTRLEIVNESHLHAGHRDAPGTGESHFRVLIVSPAFLGTSRLDRHRRVNAALAAELKGKVHALALTAAAPGETQP